MGPEANAPHLRQEIVADLIAQSLSDGNGQFMDISSLFALNFDCGTLSTLVIVLHCPYRSEADAHNRSTDAKVVSKATCV